MRKDPYQRTIDPLKVYNDHGLTFEHLSNRLSSQAP